MPPFDQYPVSPVVKALFLGDSMAGKTGSTVALGAAGFDVRNLDLDGMAAVIRDLVTNPKSIYLSEHLGLWPKQSSKELAARMSYVTITEGVHYPNKSPKPVPKAEAWGKIQAQLGKWVDGERDFGNIDTWGPNVVLVIDGLTKLSKAAWNFQLAMNGRLLTRPEQNDYWQAQKLIEEFLLLIVSDEIKCNVIITCHPDYMENDVGLTRGYPQTIGKALSPTLARTWPHVLMAKSTGQGSGLTRKIHTTTVGTIDLRTPIPLKAKPEYDLATGWAEYFRDFRGKSGP